MHRDSVYVYIVHRPFTGFHVHNGVCMLISGTNGIPCKHMYAEYLLYTPLLTDVSSFGGWDNRYI